MIQLKEKETYPDVKTKGNHLITGIKRCLGRLIFQASLLFFSILYFA